MLTPAQRHRQSALAAQSVPTVKSSTNASLLMQLVEDRRALSAKQSIAAKIELKRELLPNYIGFIDGLNGKDTGLAEQDALLLSELFVWLVDCFELPRVITLFDYMQRFSISTPERHSRDLATFTAEELSAQMNTRLKTGYEFRPEEVEDLRTIQASISGYDMPDQVNSAFCKSFGMVLAAQSNYADAIDNLKKADALDTSAGVKNDLKRLTKLLEKQQAANAENT